MKQREVETTNAANKPDPTLAQLWIVLAQLEEINIQFARWLDTLTIEKNNHDTRQYPWQPKEPTGRTHCNHAHNYSVNSLPAQ